MAKGKQPSIQVGQTFTDSNGDEVKVTNYVSATKVEVEWTSGEKQFKSAQQLRLGKFSTRTRNTKTKAQEVAQPYQEGVFKEEVQEDLPGLIRPEVKSLFAED